MLKYQSYSFNNLDKKLIIHLWFTYGFSINNKNLTLSTLRFDLCQNFILIFPGKDIKEIMECPVLLMSHQIHHVLIVTTFQACQMKIIWYQVSWNVKSKSTLNDVQRQRGKVSYNQELLLLRMEIKGKVFFFYIYVYFLLIFL